MVTNLNKELKNGLKQVISNAYQRNIIKFTVAPSPMPIDDFSRFRTVFIQTNGNTKKALKVYSGDKLTILAVFDNKVPPYEFKTIWEVMNSIGDANLTKTMRTIKFGEI